MAGEIWSDQMKQMVHEGMKMPWTVLLGILLGLFIASYIGSIRSFVMNTHAEFFPVVKYQAEIVGRKDDFVLIHVWGEKLRDCPAIKDSLESYTVRKDTLFDANEFRIDGNPNSRPVGKVDLGVWKIWPVEGAKRVRMYVSHDCDGSVIRSKIVDVPL